MLHLTEVRAIDISTGREVWRYSQRAPNMGSTLATAGNVVFFGDLNRRLWAFDAETGTVLWALLRTRTVPGRFLHDVSRRKGACVAVKFSMSTDTTAHETR